jgi:uncharacterized protein (UPF0335 family)
MPDVGGVAGERLKSFIERIERLEEEKKSIAEGIKEVYAEAKGTGFDTKTMRAIVRLRRLSQEERDEQEALLDLYKAALGMLSDTPLGEAAIRRASGQPPASQPPSPPNPDDDEGAAGAPEAPPESPDPAEPTAPEDTVDDARAKGREAAQQGIAVTANPYPARDPRRAAWDEAWCAAAGSDGMEIPAFLRRKKPEKPAKPAASDDKRAA